MSSDNWSYKTCKAPVKSSPATNQQPAFYRLSPNQQRQITERKICVLISARLIALFDYKFDSAYDDESNTASIRLSIYVELLPGWFRWLQFRTKPL